MNILHLTHGIYFGNGLETFLENLTNGLTEHKHYITCHRDRFDRQVNLNAEFIPLDSLEQIPDIIEKYNIDILHLHWTGAEFFKHDSIIADIPFVDKNKNFIKNADGTLKTQKAIILKDPSKKITIDDEQYSYINWQGDEKTKVIITCHSLEPIPSYLSDNYDLCVSVAPRCQLVQNDLKCKHRIIFNGIDTKKFKPTKNLDKFKVGLVGRVDKFDHKLLKFISEIPYFQNIEFIFAGGNYEQYLNKYPENFKFVGIQKDMVSFYNSIDLLLHPTLSDSFGYSIIEAMACGLPVIASKEFDSDIIGSNDIIYYDYKQCANFIYEYSRRKAKLRNNQNHVYNNFSTEKMCENYNNAYRQLF